MSIKDHLFQEIQSGKIVKLSPYVSTDKRLRAIYLDAFGMADIINLGDGDDDETQRLWVLKADLEHFITSPGIDASYLKILQPSTKGVYEIRSRRPSPSIRAFGMFVEVDKFFVTHFVERAPLGGGWKSYPFKQEMTKCRQMWRKVFPEYPAKTSSSGDIRELVTGGYDARLYK